MGLGRAAMRRIAMAAAVALALASTAATSAQEPDPSPDAKSGWVEVAEPLLSGSDTLEQVAATASEVLAVGSSCDEQGACDRVLLASPDGVTWTERGRLPTDVNLLADLVTDGDDLYVVGDRLEGRAAIWRSLDGGASWQLLGSRAAFRPGADRRPPRSPDGGAYDASVRALARGPAGLVAGGWLNAEDLDRAAIWLSTDGTLWERIRLPRAMDRWGGIFDVAGDAEGYVALTAEGPWRSGDGRRWRRAVGVDETDVIPVELEPTGSGFVGLGIGEGTAVTWLAGPGGSDWRRLPDDPALAGLWEAGLRASGPRVVAVGTSDGDERIPTAWLLDEGTWTAEAIVGVPGAVPADAAWIGDDILVVGSAVGPDDEPSGVAWRRSVGAAAES
jgi:hypothetical protein